MVKYNVSKSIMSLTTDESLCTLTSKEGWKWQESIWGAQCCVWDGAYGHSIASAGRSAAQVT